MPYTKQTWADGSAGNTPLSATRLTHMEDGIDDADERLTVHVGRTDNPHGTTATQVGAETPAAAQAKVDTHSAATTAVHGITDTTNLALKSVAQNTQTASYTLVLADGGKVVEMNVATANTLTVPPNSSVAFPIGTIIEVHQYGAGQTTITPGAGVTLRSNGGKLKTAAQYASASLRKRATEEWIVAGDVVA